MSDSSSSMESDDSESETLLSKKKPGKGRAQGVPSQMKMSEAEMKAAAAANPLSIGSLEEQLGSSSSSSSSNSDRNRSESKAPQIEQHSSRRKSKFDSATRRGTRRGSIHLPGNARLRPGTASKKRKAPWETGQLDKEGYAWDYVMVFKIWGEKDKKRPSEYQKEHSKDSVVRKLHKGGLQTFLYYSADRAKIYIQIRCPLHRMKAFADKIDYKVKLDRDRLRKMAQTGVPEDGVSPISIKDEKDQSWRDPYDNIFGKYDTSRRLQPIYSRFGPKRIPFRSVDRLVLTLAIIQGRAVDGCCGINTVKHVDEEALLGFYPLHNALDKLQLKRRWVVTLALPNSQPFNLVKDYYGEKIALYFAWLGHYTTCLGFSAVAGLVAGVAMSINHWNPDTKLMPPFGLFMCLWCTFFVEFWKRKESTLAMEWGMSEYEEEQQDRPQFKGEITNNPVTGEDGYMYFNPTLKYIRLALGLFVVLFMVAVVTGVVMSIFYFQWWSMRDGRDCTMAIGDRSNNCAEHKQIATGPLIAQGLNSLSIMVMNSVYAQVAGTLNKWENHRTDTEYDDMLTAKVFCFEFINSYGALFYVAFIKAQIGDSCENFDCMYELSNAVGIIFVSQLLTGNVSEVLAPMLERKLKEFLAARTGKNLKAQQSEAEAQFMMSCYDDGSLFEDYQEMAIQFGYSTLFVTAFPLAPLLALINNYIEIRVDAYKLCSDYRRPDPKGASDIGTWGTIMEVMSEISIITNTAVMVFTSKTFTSDSSIVMKIWIFVIIEHSIFGLKALLSLILPDTPMDVEIQLERQAFLVDKLIKLEADDDDEELMKGSKLKTDLTIHDTFK